MSGTSNSVCWWCCHSFVGTSLHCPYKYDDRTKRFSTTGHFCSWECMKTYALDRGGPRSGEMQMYIALMRKHSNGNKYTPVRCAPKRVALKMFGGVMSIEEFRDGSSNYVVTMPWEKHIMPDLTPVTRGAPKNAPGVVTTQPVDELILKRAKPLARAKSTLEASLGITRKTR